jgi:dsDNA-specific endonuclease/ATPase MutS2
LSHTKHLITSRNEALTSEKEILIAAHLNLERNTRESVEQSKVLSEISSKNQKLNEDLSKKVAQNQLMENECKSQMETVEKRSKDVEEYERDIDGILKFRFKVLGIF